MKRNSQIASLFKKHEAKKMVVEVDDSAPPIQSDCEIESETEMEEPTPNPPSPQQPSARSYDSHFLPHDPGERIPISRYAVNDQDDVRRGFIRQGPCQPFEHRFPTRKINGQNRSFSAVWLIKYNWLEYSIEKDAAFCFVCYLFKGRFNGGPGGDVFVTNGYRDWKRPEAFRNMWVVFLAFTTKLKRSTTYLSHPTPRLIMLL